MIAAMSIVRSSIAISINIPDLGVCAFLVIRAFFHAMLSTQEEVTKLLTQLFTEKLLFFCAASICEMCIATRVRANGCDDLAWEAHSQGLATKIQMSPENTR